MSTYEKKVGSMEIIPVRKEKAKIQQTLEDRYGVKTEEGAAGARESLIMSSVSSERQKE